MMRKSVFIEVDGFDERYQMTFSDVDLCMRIREKGYLLIWTPYAELYHRELSTRGDDRTPENRERSDADARLFIDKWNLVLKSGDPYYNRNLSLDSEIRPFSL
jgi:GT2 family glycosyltransferase